MVMRTVIKLFILVFILGCQTLDREAGVNQAGAGSAADIASALGLVLNQSTEADVRERLGKPEMMIEWLPHYNPPTGERYAHVYTVHAAKIQTGFNREGVLVDIKFADNLTVVTEEFLKALGGKAGEG